MLLLILFNSFLVFCLNYEYEFTCRLSSFVHAIFSFCGSILFLMNLMNYDTFQLLIDYNIVYITTDIYLYISNKISNKDIKEMMVHHVCFLIGSYVAYLDPYCYALGIMSEGSTIFLNMRWFAIHNYYFRNIDLFNNIFWAFFLIFRIFNITYLVYLLSNHTYYYYTLLVLPFLGLNYIWFYYLTKKIFFNPIKELK